MDVIKTLAKEFSQGYMAHGYSLEWYDGELDSKLVYINKPSEKLRFLSYLLDIVETSYKKHAVKCRNPERCDESKSLEFALYAINQQYDEYFESEGEVSTDERPAIKFFVDGQYFDAFSEIREIIKQATGSIILVDSYVSVNTLKFFPGKEPGIKLKILTNPKSVDEELIHVIKLYNEQYGNLEVKKSTSFHDRFLIIDNTSYYHIGASIKDAGNKVFMFAEFKDAEIKETINDKLQKEWPGIFD